MQDDFDEIVAPVRIEQDVERGRVALVFMFDELPGTTMLDLNELVRSSLEANQGSETMQNLTVTAAWRDQAQKIEDVCQLGLGEK